MSKMILDASALLALISQEKGAEIVEQALPDAVISTVNLSEVATVLHRIGIPSEDIQHMLLDLLPSVSFDDVQAFIAAEFIGITHAKGLSFGDRACLALGLKLGRPVLTTDNAWAELNAGVQVILIR